MHSITLYTAAITLVLIMDPIGNVPVFASMMKSVDPKRRVRIILRESLIALVVLLIFLFAGKYIMQALQVSMPALSIAGGIILFLISLKMIFPPDFDESSHKPTAEPFIVPFAIPLIAGPATMATVMLFASHAPGKMTTLVVALVIAWCVGTLILLLGTRLSKILGDAGLTAVERLMGMVLTMLAVQMLLTGVSGFIHG
jgi:MarC family membrane protein